MSSSTNRLSMLESVAHVLMGYFAGLVGLHLLLTWREYRQLPPENDRFPVRWINLPAMNGMRPAREYRVDSAHKEYWPKARVMDTLNDSREYVIGYTLATLTHLAVIVWLIVR
jgi:hypothetical protein